MAETTKLEDIPAVDLANPCGGLRYDSTDRESTNVEDRRTPRGRARDQRWFEQNRDMYSPPRPPPRDWQPSPIPRQTFPPGPE
jgi:hypothetical protein